MRKPDPRIYELTCELAGVDPEAAVFLDDNADNVEAASALGIETVHVGVDPFAAIAELDAILDAAGAGDLAERPARRHPARPLRVISPRTTVTPAAPPGSQVRSRPISATSRSMRGSVDAIVTSRTGSANAPVAHHQSLGTDREVAADRVGARVQAADRLHVERLVGRREDLRRVARCRG